MKGGKRYGLLAVLLTLTVGATNDITHLPAPHNASQLRALAARGTLESLQRHDFSRYRDSVIRLYQSTGYQPVWVQGNGPTAQAKVIISALEGAQSKGLEPQDYDSSIWSRRIAALRSGEPGAEADFDLALTVCVMRYVSDLEFGRIQEERFRAGLKIKRAEYDLAAWIRAGLIGSPNPEAALNSLEPPFAAYWRTERALAEYQRLALRDDRETLSPVRKPVRPGDSWNGLERVARLLRLVSDLPEGTLVNFRGYGGALVEAVKRFQSRHGLAEDGVIGDATIHEMNVPLAQRVRQLVLTLERWRWVPHAFTTPPIVVNIPEFELRALDETYRTQLPMKVVVGKAYGHQTPMFAAEMTHLIFRPYWEVPPGIARRELVPKFERDPAFLAENHYEIVGSDGQIATRDKTGASVLDAVRAGQYRVRQRPGADNALGGVKFMFPNEHNVYLHGTPGIELFSKTRRDFSHGCIRVEKPVELAQWVLRNRQDWTSERILDAMNGERPWVVLLDRPIPVLIVYGTAVVPETGEVHFLDDIYGQDAALERALAMSKP